MCWPRCAAEPKWAGCPPPPNLHPTLIGLTSQAINTQESLQCILIAESVTHVVFLFKNIFLYRTSFSSWKGRALQPKYKQGLVSFFRMLLASIQHRSGQTWNSDVLGQYQRQWKKTLASVYDPRDMNLRCSRQSLEKLHISTGQVRGRDDPSRGWKGKIWRWVVRHNNDCQSSLAL